MIKLYFCILVTCLFTLLAMYSLEYKSPDINAFIIQKNAEYKRPWTPKQEAIADLWNLTQNDVEQPVNLWSE